MHAQKCLRPRGKTVFGQNGASGEEEEQEQQEEFIVPKPSPSYYRRLEREEVSSSTFMVGQGSPLDLNFEFFFLASLSLPCPIERRGESIPAVEAVNFKTLARAIAYCTEKLNRAGEPPFHQLPHNYQSQPAENWTKNPLPERWKVPCNGTPKWPTAI